MTTHRDVDQLLRAHFEATADRTVMDGQLDAIVALTAGRRQQPAWLASLRSFLMSTTARSFGRPMSAPAWAFLFILALLIAIAAVGLTIGGWRLAPAPIVNGPIVFGRFDPAFDDTVIYIARPDGSEQHILLPGPSQCPQISPDGRRVAFAFGSVNIDGSDRRAFTDTVEGVNLGCSTWSPDGTRLALEGFNDADPSKSGIFLANASDRGGATRLTTHGGGANDLPGDWSPDGKEIAYIHGTPKPDGSTDEGTLWVVDVATGSNRQLVATPVYPGPTWSPDGQWILVDAGDHFLVVRPDGTDAHSLSVPASVAWVGDPQYSPDGTRLLFHMALAGSDKNDIYTMSIDGTDLVQITNTPAVTEYFTDWGIEPA
jgi:Tol biopolymer transport system component